MYNNSKDYKVASYAWYIAWFEQAWLEVVCADAVEPLPCGDSLSVPLRSPGYITTIFLLVSYLCLILNFYISIAFLYFLAVVSFLGNFFIILFFTYMYIMYIMFFLFYISSVYMYE